MDLDLDLAKGAVSSALNMFSGWDEAKGFLGVSSTITGKDGTQTVVSIENSEYDVGTLTATIMARVAGFKRVVKTSCCDAEVSGDFFVKFQITALPHLKYKPSFAHEFWNQLLLDLGNAEGVIVASGVITFAVSIGKAILDSPKAPIPVLVPKSVVPVMMGPVRDKDSNNT